MENSIILNFIKNNKKELRTHNVDSFLYSAEFNKVENNEAKRILFYMNAFINSSKKKTDFHKLVKDFSLFIEAVNKNRYLHKTHECYKPVICNYFENLLSLFKHNYIKYSNEFVCDLSHFVEVIYKIYYPSVDIKLNIIKYLKRIEEVLYKNKMNINKDNIQRYERYLKELNIYIDKNSQNDRECQNYKKKDNDYPMYNNDPSKNKNYNAYGTKKIFNDKYNDHYGNNDKQKGKGDSEYVGILELMNKIESENLDIKGIYKITKERTKSPFINVNNRNSRNINNINQNGNRNVSYDYYNSKTIENYNSNNYYNINNADKMKYNNNNGYNAFKNGFNSNYVNYRK